MTPETCPHCGIEMRYQGAEVWWCLNMDCDDGKDWDAICNARPAEGGRKPDAAALPPPDAPPPSVPAPPQAPQIPQAPPETRPHPAFDDDIPF